MRWLKKAIWVLFLLTMIFICMAVGYYFAVTKDATLQKEKLQQNHQSVLLYDQYGEPIQNAVGLSYKQTTPIETIPRHTRLAFISVEDKRFFSHNGFDTRRIVKALYNNLKARGFKEGASTISQQLIKNTHLSQEKTIKRKLCEWKLTRALERNYGKDEILEKYLNTIYFGHNCFGIRSAAEFYFAKQPCDLTVGESAILAGLVKSPNNYSPFKNPQRCLARKKTVLSLMRQQGNISQTDEQIALNEELPKERAVDRGNQGFFTFVFDELSEIAASRGLRLGGKIEIFTKYDPVLQKELINATAEIACDKSAFVLDGQSHLFKACISTIGNAKRLPGSLIKPLLVYAPALEENIISPATPILDEKINYGGYAPENYNGKYHGYVSARTCVANSLNIPAVKTLQALGTQKACEYMKRLSLPIDEEDKSLALALGGMRNGFCLKDLTAAYAALQNQGNFSPCAFIESIKINDIPVYHFSPKKAAAFSAETAYLMTDMLKSAVSDGTAKKLRSLSFKIAAKTGTVGTEKGNTDAYAVSYTTRDVVSIWLGNADNEPIKETGGGTPCQILYRVNQYLYQQHGEIPPFQKPRGIVDVSLDKISYYDTHTMILADDCAPVNHCITELFNKRFLPTKKSDFFSNPSISTPAINIKDGKVFITLHDTSPSIYQYRIDRYDYVTHTTVYSGPHFSVFCDDTIKPNMQYQYTVTPIYNGNAGVSIDLPTISTDTQFNDKKIKEKDWWNY